MLERVWTRGEPARWHVGWLKTCGGHEYLYSISRKLSLAMPQDKTWMFGLVWIEDVPMVVPGHVPVCNDAGGDTLTIKIPRAPLDSLPRYTILDTK